MEKTRSTEKWSNNAFFKFITSLRTKTITILGILFICMFSAFIIVVVSVFAKSFSKLEKSRAQDSSRVLMRAIYDDFQDLLSTTVPSAAWTEVYDLLDAVNSGTNTEDLEEFMLAQFDPAYTSFLDVDFVIYYSLNGELQMYSAYDISNYSQPLSIPSSLNRFDSQHPLMLGIEDPNTRNGGLIQDDEKLLLVSAVPVQKGDFTGPTSGLLVMAKYMRPYILQRLATATEVCLTVFSKAETKHPISKDKAIILNVTDPNWKHNTPYFYESMKPGTYAGRVCKEAIDSSRVTSEMIGAFNALTDIFGNPVLFIRSDDRRDIHKLAVDSILWTLGLLVLIGIIASMTIIVFLERAVLYPTLRLTRDVANITKSWGSDRRSKVYSKGKGEFAFMGNTINRMLEYIERLQQDLIKEKEKSEQLLLNMLPEVVSTRLKESGAITNHMTNIDENSDDDDSDLETHDLEVSCEDIKDDPSLIADSFPDVTVLFSDIVGFTQLSSSIDSSSLVRLLNTFFSAFDKNCTLNGVEKIKTIGDAFMVVSGAPTPVEDHADRAVQQGLDMLRAVVRINQQLGTSVNIRIGIHSGPVIAGVIGTSKYVYDIFGDTVDLAQRLESHGAAGCIHLSDSTQRLLRRPYVLEERITSLKDVGEMSTFLIRPELQPQHLIKGRSTFALLHPILPNAVYDTRTNLDTPP